MGKLFVLAWLIAIAYTLPPAAADATNPMIWPKHQWRSDLFSTSSPGTYRNGAHSHVRRIVRVESTVIMQNDRAIDLQIPKRAKLIRIGGDIATGVVVNPARGSRKTCRGMLILTWTGAGTTSRCNSGSGVLGE